MMIPGEEGGGVSTDGDTWVHKRGGFRVARPNYGSVGRALDRWADLHCLVAARWCVSGSSRFGVRRLLLIGIACGRWRSRQDDISRAERAVSDYLCGLWVR